MKSVVVRMVFNVNRCIKQRVTRRLHYSFCRIFVLFISVVVILTGFLMILTLSFPRTDELKIIGEGESADFDPLDLLNLTSNYIYIDIGCYNAETIEYFIHFYPESNSSDIVVFEPEPTNYQLCQHRLQRQKYSNYKIKFIQKAVWVRNEKVPFQINRGRSSRMVLDPIMNNDEVQQVDAIDFSTWLTRLNRPKHSKIHVKMSMPGTELPVLEKMFLDNTVDLVDHYEIEWSDRQDPRFRSTRIYLQLMLDSHGFDALYYIQLADAHTVFKNSGTFANITKYYNWKFINESDTFGHYKQRPAKFELPRNLP